MAAQNRPPDARNKDSTISSQFTGSNNPAQPSQYGGPLSIQMPVESSILNKARQLAGERNVRVDTLATCIVQDPILTLEILRIANAMFFVQDRPPITTCDMALVRLGSQNVVSLLDQLQSRAEIQDKIVSEQFELLRTSAKATSLIAKLLATASHKDLADESQTVGLVSYTGLMLGCIHLGTKFVTLFEKLSRASLIYRLSHSHNFDSRLMQLNYLRRYGFPEGLLFALDRDIVCKTPERTPLRFIIESAVEMVEAFQHGKLYRYAKEDELPVQSSLRLLQLPPRQYANIFKRAEELLDKTNNPQPEVSNPAKEADSSTGEDLIFIPGDKLQITEKPIVSFGEMPDDDEIQAILSGPVLSQTNKFTHHAQEPNTIADDDQIFTPGKKPRITDKPVVTVGAMPENDEIQAILSGSAFSQPEEQSPFNNISDKTAETILAHSEAVTNEVKLQVKQLVVTAPGHNTLPKNRYSFDSIKLPQTPKYVVSKDSELETSAQPLKPELAQLVKQVSSLCSSAKSVQEVLNDLLTLLIKDGPFSRAALIVLSPRRESAEIHSAVGEGLKIGASIPVNDPVSPLAACLTRIQSFNSQQFVDDLAPLGVSSYAVSPVDVQNPTPVVLYADTGSNEPLPFESRRAFRSIVGLLNRFLPTLPGTLS